MYEEIGMGTTQHRISARRYQELAEQTSQELSDGKADVLSARLIFSLLRLGNKLSKDFEVAIRQRAGLSFAGYQLLYTLNAVGAVHSNQLARLASVSTASMSSLLNTMERKKLVKRTTDSDDRRRTVIELTTMGRSLIEELYLENMARELTWSKALTRNEAEEFSVLVEKMLRHRPDPVGKEPENYDYWANDTDEQKPTADVSPNGL